MEEIDIVELLKRVKEGKAPKEIEADGEKLFYHPEEKFFERLYKNKNNGWWCNSSFITLETKIKILDKPIIEEGKIVFKINLGWFEDNDFQIIDEDTEKKEYWLNIFYKELERRSK